MKLITINNGKQERFKEINSLDELNDYLVIDIKENFILNGLYAIELKKNLQTSEFVRLTQSTYDKLRKEYIDSKTDIPKTLEFINEIDKALEEYN